MPPRITTVAAEEQNTAQEEEFQEESSQSSWDSLEQEFDGVDGADFADEDLEVKEPSQEDDVPETAEAEPEPKAEEPTPEPAPPAEAPVEEPAPEVVAEEQKVEEAPKVVEEPPQPAPQPQAPQLTDQQRQELRGQAVIQLAGGYQLSQEQLDLIETDPGRVLPTLAAELHLGIYEHVVNSVMQQLPAVLGSFMQVREVSARQEGDFFKKWPELSKYKEQTLQMARMWREMNPTATEAQAIDGIGKAAMAALGLGNVSAIPDAAATPSAPAFTPPAAPPVQRTTASSKPLNPFEELSKQWDEEEFD